MDSSEPKFIWILAFAWMLWMGFFHVNRFVQSMRFFQLCKIWAVISALHSSTKYLAFRLRAWLYFLPWSNILHGRSMLLSFLHSKICSAASSCHVILCKSMSLRTWPNISEQGPSTFDVTNITHDQDTIPTVLEKWFCVMKTWLQPSATRKYFTICKRINPLPRHSFNIH